MKDEDLLWMLFLFYGRSKTNWQILIASLMKKYIHPTNTELENVQEQTGIAKKVLQLIREVTC